MILVIDNYDSFTYNLVQLLKQYADTVQVHRNDRISIEEIQRLRPAGIMISPGPGRPEAAGICVDIIQSLSATIPTLGVCLGHQAIGYAFGGTITNAPKLMHGKTSMIRHQNAGIFQEIPNPFEATRYHSLVIERETLPKELQITAESEDGTIMGVRHQSLPIEGIQFHPESILTEAGPAMIQKWIAKTKEVI